MAGFGNLRLVMCLVVFVGKAGRKDGYDILYVGLAVSLRACVWVSRLPTPVRRRKKVMGVLRPTVITSV